MQAYNIMSVLMGIQAVNAYTSSRDQASAMRLQGEFQKQQADTNARLSMANAQDAIKRGDVQAGVIRKKASAIKGSQRVNAAAQGIDINAGSAQDLQTETSLLAANDIDTIKNNAWREAWGYRVQANNYTGQGNMAAGAAKYGARAAENAGLMNAGNYALQGAYYYQLGKDLTPKEDTKLDEKGGTSKYGYDGSALDDGQASAGNLSGYDPQDKPAKELESSDYGRDWRYVNEYERSRTNPLFGNQMENSWWRRYNE
jgi:hypothetical protein